MILRLAGFCLRVGAGWWGGAGGGARSVGGAAWAARVCGGRSSRGASDTWVILKQVRLTLG